jgi:hypothetical protein
MSGVNLVERLRTAAFECSAWDSRDTPRYTEWSELMDEAADALERNGEWDTVPD